MSRLRLGDVFLLNGREFVVVALTWHWCCGLQARIADVKWLDYAGAVVSAFGKYEVVRRDLDAVTMACNHMAWSYYRDAKRARLVRVKDIHRRDARRWEIRRERVRRLILGVPVFSWRQQIAAEAAS